MFTDYLHCKGCLTMFYLPVVNIYIFTSVCVCVCLCVYIIYVHTHKMSLSSTYMSGTRKTVSDMSSNVGTQGKLTHTIDWVWKYLGSVLSCLRVKTSDVSPKSCSICPDDGQVTFDLSNSLKHGVFLVSLNQRSRSSVGDSSFSSSSMTRDSRSSSAESLLPLTCHLAYTFVVMCIYITRTHTDLQCPSPF